MAWPTHIERGDLDLLLTYVPGVVEVRAGSPVGASDRIAVFTDVVLEQYCPPLVCRQDVYLKNSVNWELVREDVKGLNWNKIIRSS